LKARNAKAYSRPSTSSPIIPHDINSIYSAPFLRRVSTKQHHALCSADSDAQACEHSTAAHCLLETQRFILLCAISLSITIRKLLILIHTLSITQSFWDYFSRLSAPSL